MNTELKLAREVCSFVVDLGNLLPSLTRHGILVVKVVSFHFHGHRDREFKEVFGLRNEVVHHHLVLIYLFSLFRKYNGLIHQHLISLISTLVSI